MMSEVFRIGKSAPRHAGYVQTNINIVPQKSPDKKFGLWYIKTPRRSRRVNRNRFRHGCSEGFERLRRPLRKEQSDEPFTEANHHAVEARLPGRPVKRCRRCGGRPPAGRTGRTFRTACYGFVNGHGGVGNKGDAGPGIVRGPGRNNWDLSLQKIFKPTEKVNFSVRADFFNAFNHTQWSGQNRPWEAARD